MNQRRKIVMTVTLILLVLLILAAIALLIWQTVTEGFQAENFSKGLLVIAGLVLSIVKLFFGKGRRKGLGFYEEAYHEELKNAFTRDRQKKARKELLEGVRLYNENCEEKALGKFTKALKEAERAEDFVAVYLFLALAYTDMGLSERAISAYLELLRYDEKYARAWSNLGRLYCARGDRDAGVKAYERAIESDPQYAVGYNNLAQTLLLEGSFDSAIPYAKKALELDRTLLAASNVLAISYYGLGNHEEANTYVETSVKLGGDAARLREIFESIDNGTFPL